MTRDFRLPEDDEEFLNSSGYPWETLNDKNMQWLIIHGFPVCKGYTIDTVTVAIKIETGYPRAALDMAYFYPHLQRRDGKPINAVVPQMIKNKVYQRWSRHRTGVNPWIIGEDNICTHLGYVSSWFEAEFNKTLNAVPA
jgi:hypothetical protein